MSHSVLHEALLGKIHNNILLQVGKLRGSPIKPVAEFAAGIEFNESAKLTIDGGYFQPDIQLVHDGAHFPGLIIEIAYSQNGKDLARHAKSYLLGSQGNVHQVIAIEIESPNNDSPKSLLEGRVTVWKSYRKWVDNDFYLATQIVIDHEVTYAKERLLIFSSLMFL